RCGERRPRTRSAPPPSARTCACRGRTPRRPTRESRQRTERPVRPTRTAPAVCAASRTTAWRVEKYGSASSRAPTGVLRDSPARCRSQTGRATRAHPHAEPAYREVGFLLPALPRFQRESQWPPRGFEDSVDPRADLLLTSPIRRATLGR